MVIDQKVTGGAAATTLTSGMTPTVPGTGQTFTVDDATGYPPTGQMTVVIDRGESVEEKVLATRSGITFTVVSRGYDGTTATSHTAGTSTVELALAAIPVQQLFDHVDGVEVNPHDGVLLDVADHDIEARHQFGSGLAFGVPVTPTALTPDIAGNPGSGNNPAREDHVHNVPAATAVTSGLANAEGVAATFARSDHTHDQAALSVSTAELVDDAVTAAKAADGIIDANAKLVGRVIGLANLLGEAGTNYDPGFATVTLGTVSGSQGTKYGRYWKLGRFVFGIAGFHLGVGGDVTGTIAFNTPDGANITNPSGIASATGWITAARASDVGSAAVFSGLGAITNAGVATNWVTAGASANWDAGTPFNWTVNDVFQALFVYESTVP